MNVIQEQFTNDYPVRQQIRRTNGIALNVVQAGPEDGAFTLLLHGFPEFWYGWRNQIPALAGAGLRLWVPDQRGYNLSDKPADVSSYRLDELVADVVGLIRLADVDKVRVVGHDWGAMVAWWLALRHPHLVERLAILNVPHPYVFARALRRDPTQLARSLYAGYFQVPRLAEASLGLANHRLLRQAMLSSSRRGSFDADDLRQYREAWARPGALTAMLNWYRAFTQYPPQRPEDWRVRVPTLVMWGERDFALKASMAKKSAELCDDGRLILFPKATHWVQHDEAEAVNGALVRFLAGEDVNSGQQTG